MYCVIGVLGLRDWLVCVLGVCGVLWLGVLCVGCWFFVGVWVVLLLWGVVVVLAVGLDW